MSEATQAPETDPQTTSDPVVIAGGGISGLFCAVALAERGSRVVLLEASDRWGGRIETSTLDGFVAEHGPMRFQPQLQKRFDALVRRLGIGYVPFVPPTAGPQLDFPKYDLRGDEKDLDALQLLRRGILLLMGRDLTGDPSGERQQGWINDLKDPEDYDRMRRQATLPNDGRPLWRMGFWNALSARGILSHQALMKVRDLGTFYHMIPDNLNAVEWAVWWLRAMKTVGRDLRSLRGGSYELVRRLVALLERARALVQMRNGAKVSAFEAGGAGRVRVFVEGDRDPIVARHLILALPRAPLVKLSASLPPTIRGLLDTVNGFPMTKVFFVVRNAWWKCDQPPQTRANRMPTREVHYFRRPDCRDGVPGDGMVMIYTDRPATEYWRHFVVGETHDRAEVDGNDLLKKEFARWLAAEALEALQAGAAEGEGDGPGLALTDEARERFSGLDLETCAASIEGSVKTYAIRDWAREPYGAANHSWQPGARSIEVQRALAAFALAGGSDRNVHICGEAYSDYSGFIEGALTTAEAALATIR